MTRGSASLSSIRAMLSSCAPGHTFRESTHSNIVRFEGKTHALPRGSKKERDPEIQLSQIRKMSRHLSLNIDCVNKHFEGLMQAAG